MTKPIKPYSSFQSTQTFDPGTYLINWATDKLPENKTGKVFQHATQSFRPIAGLIDCTIQMFVYPLFCFFQPLHEVYASIHNKESSKVISAAVVKVPLHWASAILIRVPVFTVGYLCVIAISIIIIPISMPLCAFGDNTSSMDYFLRRTILRIFEENRFRVLPIYTPRKFKAEPFKEQVYLLRTIIINDRYAKEYDKASVEAQKKFEKEIDEKIKPLVIHINKKE
jgi:F0F1-type ATP synthase assembly protein I